MNILNEMIAKILETPEVINQIKKSLVNRDLAVEIDGKRFQIMKKKNGDEIDNLKDEVKDLKSKLYDLEISAKKVLELSAKTHIDVKGWSKAFERLNNLVWN